MSDPISTKLLDTYKMALDIERDLSQPSTLPSSISAKIAALSRNTNDLHKDASLLGRVDVQSHMATLTPKVQQIMARALSLGITTTLGPQMQRDYLKTLAATKGYISFYDDKSNIQTSFLGNFHPCKIEFGGITYTGCAEAVFQSQKCSDKKEMLQFQDADGDKAFRLGKSVKLTDPSRWDLKREEVMMHVLRAKFGQNPELKELLLATEASYLIEHNVVKGRDHFWSDNCDGTGKNMLGVCLMKLREEYGGVGLVTKPSSLQELYTVSSVASAATSANMCSFQDAVMGPHPAHVDSSGKIYKFCSRQHQQDYVKQHGAEPCSLTGCAKPRYVDPSSGKIHEFCGRTHASLAKQIAN